ncbi:MAG: ABC transporter permease [Phycisphaerae bacterium]|jgi:lipopolysaccharide transport system permease protein
MAPETITQYSAAAPRPFRSFLHPLRMVANLCSHRQLTLQLTHRDIVSRYRAARLGLLWAVLTPLALLAIYTFVFSVVFEARWNLPTDKDQAQQPAPQVEEQPPAPAPAATQAAEPKKESHGEFALYLFCGMLIFTLFAEVVTRAPTMVIANPNYVKKVVFPLEVLVISALLTALFNLAIGFGVWLVFWFFVKHALPPLTMFYLPLVVLPVCLATTGVAWVVAALGVFVRDVGHAVTLIVQALFFATPVFYKIERVPDAFQVVMRLNPLSHALEDARRVMIESAPPEWLWWLISLLASTAIAIAGYAVFMKSKRAFADVL